MFRQRALISTILLLFLPVVGAESAHKPVIEVSTEIVEKRRCYPNFCQNSNKLPNNGEMYCGPTAVVNTLYGLLAKQNSLKAIEADKPGFDPYPLIQEAGKSMRTNPYTGTLWDIGELTQKFLLEKGFYNFKVYRMYFEADIGVEELVSRISELEAIGGSAIAHVKYKAGGHFISVLGAVKKANNSLPYLIVNDPDTDAASKPCSENWELAMRGNFRNGAHLHLLYAVAPQVPTKEIPYIFGKSQAIAVENAIKNLLSDSEKNAESIRQILERTEPGIIEKSNVLKNAKDSFFDKKEEKMQK